MNNRAKTLVVLIAVTVAFVVLTAAFAFNAWGPPTKPYDIALVDPSFLDTATARESYAESSASGPLKWIRLFFDPPG